MVIIDHDKTNYVCHYCRRPVRLVPRELEEVVAGKKERWVHHQDDTPACISKEEAKLFKKSKKKG